MSDRLINISSGKPYDVYIGRPVRGIKGSDWQNPYKEDKSSEVRDGTREEVIEKFERDLRNGGPRTPPGLIDRLPELKGKVLGCWCAPKPCHGEVLLRMLEEE